MRLLFVTREPRLHSITRFAQACREQGHGFTTLDPTMANLVIDSGRAQIWAGGDPILARDVDAVVPRIGTSVTDVGCGVVAQFEAMRVPVVNGAMEILRARDKLRALQHLAGNGVPVPRTSVPRDAADLDEAIDQVGGIPCVLKLLQGTQGIGVMLAESRDALQSVMQAFWSLGHTILLQEFVAESKGKDVRAFVVGGRVVGAMRREAPVGEFRSNIHRGGKGTAIQLSQEDERVVLQAARCMGLGVTGVDYLESDDGPKIIEVNASPGFEGLEAATGADVAGAIVAYAATVADKSKVVQA